MTGTDMTRADMTGLFCRSHFDGGGVVGAVLSGPICRGCFVGAHLSWAILTGHRSWRSHRRSLTIIKLRIPGCMLSRVDYYGVKSRAK